MVNEYYLLYTDKGMTKQEMKSLAGLLQMVRKQMLDSLKSGTVDIPRHLVSMATDSSKDTNSELYQFLEEKFHNRLKK